MIDIDKIENIVNEFLGNIYLDDKIDLLYTNLFPKASCRRWGFLIDKTGKCIVQNLYEDLNTDYKKFKFINYKYFVKNIIDKCDFYKEFVTIESEWAVLCIYNRTLIYIYSMNKFIKEIVVYSDEEPTYLKDFVKESEENTSKNPEFIYITRDTNGGFSNTILEINHNLNVSLDNYNEDLPYDKMKEFCEGDSSGLMLLSGLCGTGKTTIIKKLIHDCSDTQFILLSADTLANIDSTTFMSYLIKNGSNAVLVMEDCDTLLKSRDIIGNSSAISTLLNLSDGILGDALNLKFICTYNTDESNIDKALLRKGRLKLKYVFGKLSKDRVHKLNPKLNTEMTLAEIYNTTDNNFSTKKSSKVGF